MKLVKHQGKLIGIEISIRPVPASRATTTCSLTHRYPATVTQTPLVGILRVFKLDFLFVEEASRSRSNHSVCFLLLPARLCSLDTRLVEPLTASSRLSPYHVLLSSSPRERDYVSLCIGLYLIANKGDPRHPDIQRRQRLQYQALLARLE